MDGIRLPGTGITPENMMGEKEDNFGGPTSH